MYSDIKFCYWITNLCLDLQIGRYGPLVYLDTVFPSDCAPGGLVAAAQAPSQASLSRGLCLGELASGVARPCEVTLSPLAWLRWALRFGRPRLATLALVSPRPPCGHGEGVSSPVRGRPLPLPFCRPDPPLPPLPPRPRAGAASKQTETQRDGAGTVGGGSLSDDIHGGGAGTVGGGHGGRACHGGGVPR